MNMPNENPTPDPTGSSASSPQGPVAKLAQGPSNGGNQWLDNPLTLRSELKFDVRDQDGASFVVIEDPVRSKFFQIGTREYQFIASLNGKMTPRQVLDNLKGNFENDESLDEVDTVTICQWLVQSNLAYGSGIDNAKRLNQQAMSLKRAKLLGVINPISFKIKLFNPNEALKAVQPSFQWLFSRWFLLVWCIAAMVAGREIWTHWDQMGASSTGILSGYGWLWLLLLWVGLKVIHESAHGIACRRYGGEVPEAGVLLLLFTPMAYVNVTSMWRFSSRWHRMVVAAAGMYVELFISFLAIMVWTRTNGVVADVAFNVFVMSSVTTILFNANPLMRFDGYFLLSDLMGIPNLYTKGTKWFGDRLNSLIFGLPKTPNICPAKERRRVAIYGCLAWFWKISISLSLIIGAGVLFHGAGIILSVLGVGLWFGVPIYKQMKAIFGPAAKHKVRPIRVGLSFAIMGLICFSLFSFLKAPATKSSPAIVQFADETVVRARASGFITELDVVDGESVKKGQVLVQLTNPNLANEVVELERLVVESLTQSRIYRKQKELAQSMAELKKHKELKAQLAEKRDEAAGLRLTAPFDGFVFKRNLANQIGKFAERGDGILTIAQRQSKEIVVSIDQRDLESIKGNEGEMLRVVLPGLPLFKSKLVRVNPQASDMPTHPSLCAQAGGPLPVKPITDESVDSESGVQLIAPRFNVFIELDAATSNRLHSGQRGRVFYSTCEQSLGSYIFLAAQEWLENKIELATQSAVF